MGFVSFILYILIVVLVAQLFAKQKLVTMLDTRTTIQSIITNLSKASVTIVVGVILLIIVVRSVVIIPAGAVGVFTLFGKVQDTELQSGFNIINPLGEVTKLSIRTEEYTMSIATAEGNIKGDDSIVALTNEGLEVKLDMTILYHLNQDEASEVYRMVGLNFVEKVIRPSIRSIIREEVSRLSAKEIYSVKREELSADITTNLEATLADRGIVLEDVLLRNVELPIKLAQSIQEKLTAEQESERYDFVLDKEKKEADRKRIEAAGQRDSQSIISESLSPAYLQFLYIESLKDREGTMYVPVSPDNGLPLFKNLP
ncbi:prohibitin family protein [bacterium]|uniref:Band 7 protein n=1 Tax=candidate division WWE3 bacterium CG_4_9_14_3_um_filter_39_7 TaxID=1975080 RepID=A0A2M7X036_UNCKA|nr:prohibitin family protein [bacterium]PJA39302.1 MAG: band 7 protein [candidate division WWE3 bacterium CG_4_9_14_3_um_filter_39_7]